MGGVSDVLVVALGSGGAATVFIKLMSDWITTRRPKVRVRITGPDGENAEFDAENMTGVDALVADSLVLVEPGHSHVLTLKAMRAVWLRQARAFAESVRVSEEILSCYDELDLDDHWVLSVVINYALALGAAREMEQAVCYAKMITAATRDSIGVRKDRQVIDLRLARVEWARRDGDLEHAARLDAELLGEVRARAGFNSDLTWEVERVYGKVLSKLGHKKALRARLRSVQATAWTYWRDNW